MKKIFINKLNHLISFVNPIMQLQIEDALVFRDLVFTIEDNLTFSINNKEINLKKHMLKIENCFNLDINDRKFVAFLYKKILKQLTNEQRVNLLQIETLIYDLLDSIDKYSTFNLMYKQESDLTKLLKSFDLAFFEHDKINYLDYLLDYLKVSLDVNDIKLVLSFNMLNLLTREEIKELSNELFTLNLVLIDITYYNNKKDHERIIIDKDWCVF